MSDIELKAYNYFTLIEDSKMIDSSLWVQYIQYSNNLTGKSVKVRKCVRRLKQAHNNLSDYFKLKK